MMKRFKATIKWWDDNRGFGYVILQDGREAFVHYTKIIRDGWKTLYGIKDVEVTLEETPRGLNCSEIYPIEKKSKKDSQKHL